MKNLIITVSLLTLSHQAFTKCNSEAIGYERKSGFGLSFEKGKTDFGYYDQSTTNVPLSINRKAACFKQLSAFKITSEKKKQNPIENNILITPLKAKFENVPVPHVKQYIFAEKNNDRIMAKFHTMSFVCSGEIPLSAEAASDTVASIQLGLDQREFASKHIIATGIAAQNLNYGFSPRESFELFTKLYKEKTQKELKKDFPCCTDYKIPSIISATSIHAFAGIEKTIASSFTTMAKNVPNGCSDDFAQTMKNYQLENFEFNETLTDYKIKKTKADDYLFEWKSAK